MAVAEQTFLPVAELSTYQSKWTIKARVTNKAPMRTFSKGYSGNGGKVFSVDLLDAMGGEIRASFFNEAADKFNAILEKGKCFTFSGGRVKVANRQYNNCNHRYELTFDSGAVVEMAKDDASIEVVKFSFVTLRAVAARNLPTTVDLCGVITGFKPVQPIKTKEGVELVKREIDLADDTATSMTVTLWGERAKQEDRIFEGKPVVVLKTVTVKEFRESRQGSLSQGGEFILQSTLPEAKRLQQWWSQGGSSQELKNLSEISGGGGGGWSSSAIPTTLSGLRTASEKVSYTPEIYSFVARLALVMMRKQGEARPLHYMACQELRENNRPCNKRVDEGGFCPSCNRAGKVAPRLAARCRLVDFEDGVWLGSFHEAATKIIGMSGEEVKAKELAAAEKGEGGREELEAAIRKNYFAKPMKITVRAKMDSYQGESRTDVSVIDASPVTYGEHGRQMLSEIQGLLSQQAAAGA